VNDLKELALRYENLTRKERSEFDREILTLDKGPAFLKQIQDIAFFRETPPTPQEFLDPANGWLPKQFIEDIFDHVKEDFIAICSGDKYYSNVVQYGATRCHGKDTRIRMHDLSVKAIQDIVVGDVVMGDDGGPRVVTATHRGHDTLYRVDQNKAASYTVTGDHILCLYDTDNPVEMSVRDFLKLPSGKQKTLRGMQATSSEFTNFFFNCICVTEIGDGEFFGITTDGNHRYCLEDLTVTHNCGKSFTARLIIIYTIVYLHYMKSAPKYYGLPSNSKLAMYILSFNLDKIKEVYLNPIYSLLEQSDRFVQTKFQDDVNKKQAKLGDDVIVYSKATLTNKAHLTVASGLQLVSGNDEQIGLLGADVISLFASEISFWILNEGASEDKIFQLYTKGNERIKATVGKKKLAFTYLDSSAYNADSKIENFILKTLSRRDDTFFRSRKRWEVPELVDKMFPIWKETRETFYVVTGDGNIPARIVEGNVLPQDVPVDLVEAVPIDSYNDFEANLLDSIRDVIGRPTSMESKFIGKRAVIDNVFDPDLVNVESILVCDSEDDPRGLIWHRICDKFFTKYDGKNYCLRRAPHEPRWIGLDLATSRRGDVLGFAMFHKEIGMNGKTMLIGDMAFAVGPGENGINLDAITSFITDLKYIGNVPIKQVNTDTFQSDQMIQHLNRHEILTLKSSVDRHVTPYNTMLNCLMMYGTGIIRVGRNIFLKNNLISLQRVKGKSGNQSKIDHTAGNTTNIYDGDWEKSKAGENAKDVSDAVTQCVHVMMEDESTPSAVYEKQNDRARPHQAGDPQLRARVEEARKLLRTGLGLR